MAWTFERIRHRSGYDEDGNPQRASVSPMRVYFSDQPAVALAFLCLKNKLKIICWTIKCRVEFSPRVGNNANPKTERISCLFKFHTTCKSRTVKPSRALQW